MRRKGLFNLVNHRYTITLNDGVRVGLVHILQPVLVLVLVDGGGISYHLHPDTIMDIYTVGFDNTVRPRDVLRVVFWYGDILRGRATRHAQYPKPEEHHYPSVYDDVYNIVSIHVLNTLCYARKKRQPDLWITA